KNRIFLKLSIFRYYKAFDNGSDSIDVESPFSCFPGSNSANFSSTMRTVADRSGRSLSRGRHSFAGRRAQSIGPFESFAYRLNRARSSGRFDEDFANIRARSVEPGLSSVKTRYGFYDYLSGDRNRGRTSSMMAERSRYFDRYSELSERTSTNKRPIIDGYYNHFRPYYWYSTAPRTVSYFYPYSDWRYTPRHHTRSPSLYSSLTNDDTYVWRLHGALSSVKSLQGSNRDLSYLKAMRNLNRSNAFSAFPSNNYDKYYRNMINPYIAQYA
ncbi:hypothetical protein GJ496_004726, partial [Pomphorhynchus laevis]